jgi:putative effector of murein hydrolase
MAMHGKISPSLARSATVLASLASATVTRPVVWQITKDKSVVRRLTLEMALVVSTGIIAVTIDRIHQLSELLTRK